MFCFLTFSEEAEARFAALKSQFEDKIKNIEKDLSEARQQASASSNVPELKDMIEKLKAENADLQTKVYQLFYESPTFWIIFASVSGIFIKWSFVFVLASLTVRGAQWPHSLKHCTRIV